MNSKYLNLLNALIEHHPGPVTAANLSVALRLSTRSIKNYIKEINSLHPACVYSSHSGYNVNFELAKALIQDNGENLPQTSKQRSAYILKKLLKQHDLDKFDICEELFISMSTLQSVLSRVKNELSQSDLRLATEKDKICIVGSEPNKRKLYSKVLYEEYHSNFMDLDAISKAFPEIDIVFIKDNLEDVLLGFQFFVNDYSLTNLVLHIAIAVNRNQSGNVNLEASGSSVEGIDPGKLHAAKQMITALENKFQIKFSDEEIHELVLLFVFRVSFISGPEIDQPSLQAHIPPETLDLVKHMIKLTNDAFGINLGDEYYFTRFALHISNLLRRSKHYNYNKNPLTKTLKVNSPLVYETAVYMSSIIRQKTGVAINDDEIAYIAMHIGNAICTQKEYDSKIRTVLYCPNYYNMNSQLAKMLEDRFSSEIILTNIYEDESQIDEIQDDELLVSTVPLNQKRFANCVLVNVFLQGKSISDIRQILDQLNLQKKRSRFEGHLRHIMLPELFEVTTKLNKKPQTIRHMVNQLVRRGYVNPSFEDEVLERESISGTAFHGFAIPHSLEMNANRTGMCILINPDTIDWGDHPVQLVLMLCFKPDERHIFHEIFNSLTMILNDSSCFAQIVQCENYEEFIGLITSLVE